MSEFTEDRLYRLGKTLKAEKERKGEEGHLGVSLIEYANEWKEQKEHLCEKNERCYRVMHNQYMDIQQLRHQKEELLEALEEILKLGVDDTQSRIACKAIGKAQGED